jgi:hypothetical protein
MTDRKALSLVFRRARLYLAARGENFRWQDKYICHAIDSVQGATLLERIAARNIITDRIEPFNCVEGWLVHMAQVIHQDEVPGMEDQIQQFRHRWLDELAHEFNKEFDQ